LSERMRVLAGVAGCALVLSLEGCGGGDSPTAAPTPVPTPTPTLCTQTNVVQEAGGIRGRTLVYDDFSVPDSGRLDVTLDWTNASSQVGFYLVPVNTCTLQEFNASTCTFLIRSETMVKPRKISTANFAAGNYRWIVGNYSEADESVSFQIVLSKGTCPALGVPPAASDRSDFARPALLHAEPR
jgi:hypothetical protein